MNKAIKKKIRKIVSLLMELNEVTNWNLDIEISRRKIRIWNFRNNDCEHYIDTEMGSIYFDDEVLVEKEINKVLEKLKKDLVEQRILSKEEVKCQK